MSASAVISALARSLLAGEPITEDVEARAARTLGRRWRWPRRLLAAMLRPSMAERAHGTVMLYDSFWTTQASKAPREISQRNLNCSMDCRAAAHAAGGSRSALEPSRYRIREFARRLALS